MPDSWIDPSYSSGGYFQDPARGAEDADFKAAEFLKLFLAARTRLGIDVTSYIDVGCGSGALTTKVASGLLDTGLGVKIAKGYDVSPHVTRLGHEWVRFVNADFCRSDEQVDLVTLFDVVEHIPAPADFLAQVARRCKVLGLHIPLDSNLNTALRNLFRSKLADPGHLLFLDTPSALNLLAIAGLRVIDYRYTFGFQAPSGHKGLAAKVAYPFRAVTASLSPWLLSKTLGGSSLMVVALTAQGMAHLSAE